MGAASHAQAQQAREATPCIKLRAVLCAQLLVVSQARSPWLPTASKGMLRLVLRAGGGVRLTLHMDQAALGFWGAELDWALHLRLQLHCATDQHMLQLAAPGSSFPGVTQLSLVSTAWQHVCLYRWSPHPARCH